MTRQLRWRLTIGAVVLVAWRASTAFASDAVESRVWAESSGWRPEVTTDERLHIHWGEDAKLSLGGLLQLDGGYLEHRGVVTPQKWQGELRRARFDVTGLFMSRFLFKAEYDFAHSSGRAGALDVKYKDVYIGVTRLGPFGTLRVGHFKEPYSFQFLIDAGDRTFMEEALPIVLTPGRNMGIALNHHLLDQRITWAIGAFQNVTDDSNFFGKDKQTNLTLRFTTLPLYADGGRKLVHVGGAYSHQFRRDDDTVRYQQRPETDLADQLWDTGDLPSESQDAVGAELALNLGPFWAQLETSVVYLNTMGEGSNHFKAAYVQLGFFLTGEHRPYDTALGVYTRVRPRRPVTRGGWGAWEIAARASYIDLNNKLVRGGYGDEAGAALNWYLHSSVRIGVNYLHTHRNGAGSSNIVMIRGQLRF